ncbi:phosphoglycerate dehydrogenase [Staphylococcus nepalensis]|uniref:phosphoglycerate dehydrogenase n=1 Tax=Staphylococcus nepalensis TaxID=214473 RepID=UPI003514128D
MKAVSLKRLDGLEGDLVDTFPNVNFVFTSGISEINDNDKKDLDILFGYDSAIDQTFLEECPNLKWLAWYSTGVNKLPLEYIDNQNILLTNGKGVHAKQMSEFIIAFILDDYKHMSTSFINQKHKYYDSKLTGKRVSGQKVLFLGTGSIAQKTAKIANAMDVIVQGVNTSGHSVDGFSQVYAIDELTSALPEADIVVNTLPETKDTIHLLQRSHFEAMKDTALFINVGRGTIVDENIIANVLKDKLIRHAYLDVFENEPLNPDNQLYNLDNISITAHITGNGIENQEEVTDIFQRNLVYFLNKHELIENVVNPQAGY